MGKKIKKFSGEEGSYILPSQVRTFVDTLSGDTSPITEKNFSASELQQMRDAIDRSRTRQEKQYLIKDPNSKETNYISAVKAGKRPYDQSVDYGDYGDDAMRQKRSFRDYSPLPADALVQPSAYSHQKRNSTGRPRYIVHAPTWKSEKPERGQFVAARGWHSRKSALYSGPFGSTTVVKRLRSIVTFQSPHFWPVLWGSQIGRAHV